MRSPIHNFLVVAAVLCVAACAKKAVQPPSAPELNGTVTANVDVIVRGVRSHEGQIRLALFASPDAFPGDPEKAIRRMTFPIEGDPVRLTLTQVPAGRFALSVLHDENDNNEMETNFFGRPTEGYGFSNNARATFGPPGFDDAAFEVAGKTVTIEIDLVYH